MKKIETGYYKPRYGHYDFHVREKESQLDDGPPKVSFVVKADVDGSLDAIVGCLNTYKSSDVEMVIPIKSECCQVVSPTWILSTHILKNKELDNSAFKVKARFGQLSWLMKEEVDEAPS